MRDCRLIKNTCTRYDAVAYPAASAIADELTLGHYHHVGKHDIDYLLRFAASVRPGGVGNSQAPQVRRLVMLWRRAYDLKFSWVVPRQVACSRVPMRCYHVDFLLTLGVRSVIRLARENTGRVATSRMMERVVRLPSGGDLSQQLIAEVILLMQDKGLKGRPAVLAYPGTCVMGQTLMSCYLVSQGYSPEKAISQVRKARVGYVEPVAEEGAVRAFQEWWSGTPSALNNAKL